MTAHPISTQFPGHGCTDNLTNSRSFDLPTTWVINVLGLFFSMQSMGACGVQQGTGTLNGKLFEGEL